MLKSRIVTAVVMLVVLTAALFLLPNFWWGVVLVLPLLIAGREWSRLGRFSSVVEVFFLALLLLGCILLWLNEQSASVVVSDRYIYAVSLVFWFAVVPCWLTLKWVVRHPILLVSAGIVMLLPCWLALVQLQNKPLHMLLLLMVVWIADSAAYFAGRALGRNKLAPAISPGKTWEGVGGAVAAVTVYAVVLHFSLLAERDLALIIAAFLIMTTISIIGDLFESWIKRCAGVKDSGSILPGHGGILDRIDSLAAALPVTALLFA